MPTTVTNLLDSGTGSLRQAVIDTAPGGTVDFQAGLSGFINLASEITVNKPMTIAGPGPNAITLNGDNAVRILLVDDTLNTPANVSVAGLRFLNGKDAVNFGGAIRNLENLTVSNCVFVDNVSAGGGAIHVGGAAIGGTLNVSNSVFSGNTATSAGGAIFVGGSATIANCTFEGNHSDASGGALQDNSVESSITITASSFTNNTAATQGGAIFSSGTLNVPSNATQTSFSTNTATTDGGALYKNSGTANLTGIDAVGNTANGLGGGILVNAGATVNLTESTLRTNQARIDGGGMRNLGTANILRSAITGNTAGTGGSGSAAGLQNWESATMLIRDTTISGNSAASFGGGIANRGAIDVLNSTISGNGAKKSGGGFYTPLGTTTFTNVTITGNRSDSDDSGGELGGGISQAGASTVDLFNTIVAGNYVGTGTTANDANGTLNPASKNNLIGDAASNGGIANGANGNIVGIDGAGVRPIASILDTTLANNGGPNSTHALVVGSVAIGAGSNADAIDQTNAALANDQRGIGFARISGTNVDLGALELQNQTAPTTTISAPSVSTTTNGPITYTVTYASASALTISLALADITLNQTGSANGTIAVSGTGNTRTVTISNITGNGTLGISVAAGKAVDAFGNLAPAAGPSAAVTVNSARPTFVIDPPSRSLTKAGPVEFRIFYLDATGFDASKFVLDRLDTSANGTVAVTSPQPGVVLVTVRNVTGNGKLRIRVLAGAFSNGSGLRSSADNSRKFAVDNTGPTVTIGNPSRTQAERFGRPVTFRVTFRDPHLNSHVSTGLTARRIILVKTGTANATVTVVRGAGNVRTIRLSNFTGAGTLAIRLPAGMGVDILGNRSLKATSRAITVIDAALA